MRRKKMGRALLAILTFLLNKRYIGGKHFPEKKLIISRTKWLGKKERKEFENEYKEILTNYYLIRLRKKTGKDSDWHISLNPKKIKDIYEMVKQ